jgi:hypothetical protein
MSALRIVGTALATIGGAVAVIGAIGVFVVGAGEIIVHAGTAPVVVKPHEGIRVEIGSNHADPMTWVDTDQTFTAAIANLSDRHFDKAGLSCDAIKANGHIVGHVNEEAEDLAPGVTKDVKVWIYGTAGRTARIDCAAYVIEHDR